MYFEESAAVVLEEADVGMVKRGDCEVGGDVEGKEAIQGAS